MKPKKNTANIALHKRIVSILITSVYNKGTIKFYFC